MAFESVHSLLTSYKEVASVFLKDMSNGTVLIEHNISRRVRSASIIKLYILATIADHFENKALAPEDTHVLKDGDRVAFSIVSDLSQNVWRLDDLATLMITQSDNTATNILIDILGIETINHFIKTNQLTGTQLQRKMMDFALAEQGIDNFTTLKDAVSLLDRVYSKELISPRAADWFMDVLRKQKDRKMLGRFLPESIPFSNKTGLNHGVQHDIGFFDVNGKTYMVGVFLEGISDEIEGFELIGRLAKQVYEEVENA